MGWQIKKKCYQSEYGFGFVARGQNGLGSHIILESSRARTDLSVCPPFHAR
jgi:hypothetical protein